MPGLGCSGPCGKSRRAQITGRYCLWRAHRVGAVVCGADLDARRDVIDDADGLGVCEAGQRVWDDMKLHLPWRLRPGLLPVDGFAGGALQAAVLGRACWAEAPGVPPGPQPLPNSLPGTHPLHAGQPTLWPTLLPLEYMATRQSRWYMWPQRPRRPTSSGLTLLVRSTPS